MFRTSSDPSTEQSIHFSASTLCLLAFTLVMVAGCKGEPPAAVELQPTPRPVRTVEVVEIDLPARQRFPGALRARERAALAFLHPGTLAARHVQLGQPVAAGESLATLHNRPYTAHCALAIEPQAWPDAPHNPRFPDIALYPDDPYAQTSTFRFSAA